MAERALAPEIATAFAMRCFQISWLRRASGWRKLHFSSHPILLSLVSRHAVRSGSSCPML